MYIFQYLCYLISFCIIDSLSLTHLTKRCAFDEALLELNIPKTLEKGGVGGARPVIFNMIHKFNMELAS